MANKLIEIEGIGPKYAAKLEEAGLKNTDQLLKAGATRKGRETIAEQTGISSDHILRWVNMADLFRIKGIGEEFSDLLEQAGVDTVKELRTRNCANLHAKLVEVNAEKSLTRRNPSMDEVEGWIAQAKELEPVVTY